MKATAKKKTFGGLLAIPDTQTNYFLKATAVAIVAVFLFVVVFSILFYTLYRNSLIEELTAFNGELLDRSDQMIAEAFGQIESLALQSSLDTMRLINKSNDSIVHDYYRLQTLTNNLINMKNSHSYIHSIYIYFNQGNILVTSFMGTTSYSLFYDTGWFDVYCKHSCDIVWMNSRKPYNKQYEGSTDLLSKYYGDTNEVFTLLVPLPESLKSQGGVIIVNVYQSEIANLLINRNSSVEMYVANPQGEIILSADDILLHQAVSPEVWGQMSQDNSSGHLIHDAEEMRWLYLYMPSRFNDNVVFMRIPLSQILRPTDNLLRRIMIFSAILLVVACSLVYLLLRLSYRPVRQLYKTLIQGLAAKGTHLNAQDDLPNTLLSIVQDNKALTKLWDNNRTLIRHRTLSVLLQGHFTNNEDFQQRLAYMDIRFPYPLFACVLIHLDVPTQSHTLLNDEYELIKMQLFPMIRDCLSTQITGYTVDIDDLNIGLILNLEQDLPSALLNTCRNIQHTAVSSGIIPYTLSFGIGPCVMGMSSISSSFQNACIAADYVRSLGGNEIISSESISIADHKHAPVITASTIEQKLLPAIRIGDIKAVEAGLDSFFSELSAAAAGISEIQQFCLQICNQVLNMLLENGIYPDSAGAMVSVSVFRNQMDAEQSKHKLYQMIENVCSQIVVRRDNRNADTIEKITHFVQQNYMHEITLNQVAENVFMSVPYLCKVFKEYTGKTFMDYLTGLRIDASVQLLAGGNRKIMEVAQSVGFTNVQAFIRAFKKCKNMTPSEFRESVIEKNL